MTTWGIIWLASYPKSGNTWLRAFLANYMVDGERPLPINDLVKYAIGDGFVIHYERLTGRKAEQLSEAEINRLRPRVQEWFATSKGQTVFVKTHNLVGSVDGTPLITPAATAGAIYVLRNPLDVAVSYAHYFRKSVAEAVEALCRKDHVMPGGARALPQYLGSWSQHVRSWTEAPGLKPHVMRYEDMLAAPVESFRALADFLRWPPEPARLDRAVRFSAFRELAGQESEGPFRERAAAATSPFFRRGEAGDWREALSERQVRRMISAHGETMRRFGYLNAAGEAFPFPAAGSG